MRSAPNVTAIVAQVEALLSRDIPDRAKLGAWSDRQWTDGIHAGLSDIGHGYGFRVFATQSRCATADGPEWLYDHQWQIVSDNAALIRLPLIAEIEWGFGAATMFERIKEDFLKLVQARADLRVMVFQGRAVEQTTSRLIEFAESFEGTQVADRYLFAGWCWDTHTMRCREWNA
jgi:hypothetical protein